MKTEIYTDFEGFSKMFTGKDNRIKEISNFDAEAKVIVTYSIVKILDSYIRNRNALQERKMTALTYMRYIYANQNAENKCKLLFSVSPNMKFFIKNRFAEIMKLTEQAKYDDGNRKYFLELSDYARTLLYSVHEDSPEANRYVRNLI